MPKTVVAQIRFQRGNEEKVRQAHIAVANAYLGHYSQYVGYFDDWELAEVRKSATYKGGARLNRFDIVLAKRRAPLDREGKVTVSVFDVGTGSVLGTYEENVSFLND